MIVKNGHSLQSKYEVRKWKHVIWYLFFNNLTINKIEGQDNGTEVAN
jgi:hypothetical protein